MGSMGHLASCTYEFRNAASAISTSSTSNIRSTIWTSSTTTAWTTSSWSSSIRFKGNAKQRADGLEFNTAVISETTATCNSRSFQQSGSHRTTRRRGYAKPVSSARTSAKCTQTTKYTTSTERFARQWATTTSPFATKSKGWICSKTSFFASTGNHFIVFMELQSEWEKWR